MARKRLHIRVILATAGVVAGLTVGLTGMRDAMGARYTDSEIRQIETSDESKIREIREQEINQLRMTLGRRQPQNRMADLYFRLAEIYLEAYRQEFLLEGRAHERRIEQRKNDPFIDRSRSKPYLEAGIKACQEILAYRIPYAKLDQVYYFLGFNSAELGRSKDAQRYYQELLKRYPASAFAGEAARELGELYYNDKDYRKAIPLLEASLKRSTDATRPRIQHRLAWCYYRTKQYGRAIEAMKIAIQSTSQGGQKLLSLKEEALRDMAIFMTESGRVEEAISYFDQVAGSQTYYSSTLEKLGKNYERNVEPEKATQVYEALLKTRPESEGAFRVLVKLVDLDLRRGRIQAALNRITHAKLESGSFLTGGGDEETQTAAQNLKAMVRRTATENHERYRKKSDRGALTVAESAYSVYLRVFLKNDARNETPEIKMYLAEVKRELGKSKEASDLYRQVVQSKDARFAKEAGVFWTASLADAIRKAPARNGVKSDAPSELELEYVEAADRLSESLPGSTPAREARLRAAQVLAGYGASRKDAVSRAREIALTDAGSPQAVTAARLWLQQLQDHPELGDLERARTELLASSELLKTDAKNGGKLKAQIQEQITRAQIAAIAQEEKDKDFAGAAKGYEKFAADTQEREAAEKALGSAVGSYLRAGEFAEVERVLAGWFKRYPRSGKASDSLRSVATFHLIQGEAGSGFEAAAKGFQRLGQEGDADALETAGRILEGLGDAQAAQVAWVACLEQFPKSTGRARVAYQLARLQESLGLDREAAAAYRSCASGDPAFAAECGARLGDLYERARDLDKAQAQWKSVAQSKSGGPWVGYARFRIAEQRERDARFEPLKLPEASLKKGLDARVAFLESLTRSYNTVVDAGGPWAVTALHRLSRFVSQIASDIDAAQPLPSMDAAAVAQFRKNLKGVSQPLRDRAQASWAESFKKAEAAQALSPALPEIGDALSHTRAGARTQGAYPSLRIAGLSPDGGKDGRKVGLERTREKLTRNAQDAAAWVDYGNLLWGDAKSGLARLAYDRALSINARHAAALNNRGVVRFLSASASEWSAAPEAMEFWAQALKSDDFLIAAKWNRASILSYYRLWGSARPLWEQVGVKNPAWESEDGVALALVSALDAAGAQRHFAKADEIGAPRRRFAKLYGEATLASRSGACAEEVRDRLSTLSGIKLQGFEAQSVQRWEQECKK